MLARVHSAAVLGIDAYVVEVETDIVKGLPSFATVGLPHGAVKEGRERVNAAIINSGLEFPLKRITVNLAPAGDSTVRMAGRQARAGSSTSPRAHLCPPRRFPAKGAAIPSGRLP